MEKQPDVTDNIDIAHLYPELSSEQQSEAAVHLTRYVDLVCRIYERNHNLTGLDQKATI